MNGKDLLPLADAIRAVLDAVPAPRRTTVPLTATRGLVLAEDVFSDLDMPPFEKSMMDGYAVRAAELADAPVELDVAMVVHAGALPEGPLPPGRVAKVMTGAPVPEGADAVVMVERTEPLPGGRVRIDHSPRAGDHISHRGEDAKVGDRVLSAGRPIGPSEVAVLAAVGAVEVPVFARPRIAVFTTGDEVVPPGQVPGPGRIRNSNSAALASRARQDGAEVEDRGIVRDDLDATRAAVREVLDRFDLVVLTGGVSMGDRDIVGAALVAEGFEEKWHKVALKPGKPMLFGVAGESLVFALPGNPVSVAVTYELLVRPVVRSLLGRRPVHHPRVRARLESRAPRALPREQYLPARLNLGPDGFSVVGVATHGSADLFGYAGANAFLVVPAGGPAPETGGTAEAMALDDDLSGLMAGECDA